MLISENLKTQLNSEPLDMDRNDCLSWYLVRTKPKQEKVAELQLQRQSYRVYLPIFKRWTNKHGHWQGEEGPWFPGYLFIRQANSDHSLVPVRSTYGVLALVSFGPLPEPVDPEVITSLKELEQQQQSLYNKDMPVPFGVGESVTIEQGPFRGCKGIVSWSSRERVSVLLSMLGTTVKASIDINAVTVS